MSIYLDNSATTRVSEKAAAAALKAMREDYGNPSSLHGAGVAAYHALNQARSELAAMLRVGAEELYFTSGGSEGNNLALAGGAQPYARRGGRIVISAVEHPSVSEPARRLAERGFELVSAPVDARGLVIVDELEKLLDQQTVIVSVMQVNNELGSVQPLAEIGARIRAKAPQALFHIDAVQGFGRLPIDVRGWRADALTLSGHKLHAPKGVGLLWLKKDRRIAPQILGGGQERGLRSGTENMPGVLALAAAAGELCAHMAANAAQMRALKTLLARLLLVGLADVRVNGPEPESELSAPHILNMSFGGVKSEVLLHSLEAGGLYVSSGSACSSHGHKGSATLAAIGLPAAYADAALRFSLCPDNSEAEIREAARLVIAAVRGLRALGVGKR